MRQKMSGQEEDYRKLAKEKAKKEARTRSLIILTPLSIMASIIAVTLPGSQGPFLFILLLIVFLASNVVAEITLYEKYLKELASSKKRRRSNEK